MIYNYKETSLTISSIICIDCMIDTCDQKLSKESRLEATRNEMNLRCFCTVANQVKKTDFA